jgi:arylsulfatase A-like enzyme
MTKGTTMFPFPRFATCLLLASVLVWTPTSVFAQEKKPRSGPNIVILLADDLGYGDIGVHGVKEVATPHIDSLAKNGVRCTSGYVTGTVCSPTRAGLLSGRYQQRFGHEFNPARAKFGGTEQGLPAGVVTLADMLRLAGYATGLIGKWHLGETDGFHPQQRGFDEYFGFLPGAHGYFESADKTYGPVYRGKKQVPLDGYLTDVFAKEATGFIERNKSRPFFLYLAFNAVHTPMHAPEKTVQQFAKVEDPTRRTYLAMLAKLDEAIGQVLAKLRELGLEEDTLIFFLSDNGGPTTKFAPNGSRNGLLRGSKGDTWEGGIRVPFLVQWKGKLPAGKTYDHPVISLDIAATALAAARYAPKAEWKLDGVNLLPYLDGKQTDSPHAVLYWRFGTQMAIRKGDYVLVRPSQGTKEYENIARQAMLFNVAKDIGQTKDLAAVEPKRVREMQADWDRWSAAMAQPRWPATLRGEIFKMP